MIIIDKGDLTFDKEEKLFLCLSVFFFHLLIVAIIIGAVNETVFIIAPAGMVWIPYQLLGCFNKSTKYVWNL